MLKERKAVTIKGQENVKVPFGNEFIEVKPYITFSEQKQLIAEYVESYFSRSSISDSGKNVFEAHYVLLIGVLDVCTNIQLFSETGEALITVDDFISNWDSFIKILSEIKNYEYFMSLVEKVIFSMEEDIRINNSIGKVLGDFSSSLNSFLSKVVSGEALDSSSISQIKEIIEEINSSPILGKLNPDTLSPQRKIRKPATKRKKNVKK